ncbi:MAG: ferric reductase-like transmembrane domain-containing protein [Candidatus Omnitrophica bacterium]|nr:ferric reductase-like transmembrane domain-containing protein [Candidatus Omnitrophota bacterium]
MKEKSRLNYLIPWLLFYLVIPFSYLLLGNFPKRTVLKNAISFLTLGAYFIMLGQFYLSRSNVIMLRGQKMSKVFKLHKVLSYIFIPILISHPFLIVVPRFFESGVEPIEAFRTIMTTFGSRGIVLGIFAMVLMLFLGITSIFQKKMQRNYRSWRISHGLLSSVFIVLATWHAVDLGRHTDIILSAYMIILLTGGIFLLIRTYFIEMQRGDSRNG